MHCPIHLTLFDTKDAWLLGGGGGGLGGDSAYESGGDARRLA